MSSSDNHTKWWSPRWTLGIGIPAFIFAVAGLFIACRYYVGHPNDTPAFVAGVIGLLTLAAIVAQAVIYKRQSDLMLQGLGKTNRLIAQNERIIEAATKQSEVNEKALVLTENHFYIAERAYLTVKDVAIHSLSKGRPFGFHFHIKNGGRTPAFNVKILIHTFFSPADSDPNPDLILATMSSEEWTRPFTTLVVLPGDQSEPVYGLETLDGEIYTRWTEGHLYCWIAIQIKFDDIRGSGRSVIFLYNYGNDSALMLVKCFSTDIANIKEDPSRPLKTKGEEGGTE